MSCTLQSICEIGDVNQITNLLTDLSGEEEAIVDKGFEDDFDDQSWGNDWNNSDEWDSPSAVPSSNINKSSWLQSCHISLSPTEELLVFAKKEKGVFLAKRWCNGNKSERAIYERCWSGCLSENSNEYVTCVACIPLASQQRSSEGTPDWTCVVAGFTSGYVRMYMPNGCVLLAQYLHDEQVINIKLKTKLSFKRHNHSDQIEELCILYPSAIVTVDGFSLYQSLRACRNQLARAQASSISGGMLDPPSLAYHKWKISEQKIVNDVASSGVTNLCLFDRLKMTSVLDGVHGRVKGSAPAFTSVMTIGKEPFFTVFHAIEGSSQPMISEVASAVASKLKSAVFSRLTAAAGWFGGTSQDQSPSSLPKDRKPKIEGGTPLKCIACLPDSVRHAGSIKVSTVGPLAVITDSFNRVSLVDTTKGIIVRMFKGYRDAECGWIVVEEEDVDADHLCRKALFLVIYAPKRGILEIYHSEQGARVGAFNVGKDCRLLCPGYNVLNQTISSETSADDPNQCFLLQSDGVLKSIYVPFYCALSKTNSGRVKDSHLFKELSNLMEKPLSPDDEGVLIRESMVQTVLEIHLPNTQQKAVDSILNSSKFAASFLKVFMEKLIHSLNSKCNKDEEDLEYLLDREKFFQYCISQQELIDLFISIDELKTSGEDSKPDMSGDKDEEWLANLLHVSLGESQKLLQCFDRYVDVCLKNQTEFKEVGKTYPYMSINKFLQCFNVTTTEEKNVDSSSSSSTKAIKEICDSLTGDMASVLGEFFFKAALTCEIPVTKLVLILETSKLPPQQIMKLLAFYMQSEVSCDILDWSNLPSLHSLISSVCSLKGGFDQHCIGQNVGKESKWWQDVREILSDSIHIGQSLLMAVSCRSVAIELTAAAQKVKPQDESDILRGGWESVTMDMEQWNFLIGQLENLLELDCFVHSNHMLTALSGMDEPFQQHIHTKRKFNKDGDTQHKGRSSRASKRIPVLSVKGIHDAGFGAISQIVAECLVRQGVPGPCLGFPKSVTTPRKGTAALSLNEEDNDDDDIPDQDGADSANTLSALVSLREIFPHSLEQDVLWLHCAWECIMLWNEDSEDIDMLSSALVHLSCVHNPLLEQGLGVMMWKAVYKETIKSLSSLIDKIGKAPKDRLCKKTVSLGYKALEEFLSTARKLLEILMEIDINDDDKPELPLEELWQYSKSTQRSIVEQAADEPISNQKLLNLNWCHVTVLYLIMAGVVKSVKPSSLFDSRERHSLHLPLHGNSLLSQDVGDTIREYREKFCRNTVAALIKNHISLHFDDEVMRNKTSHLMFHLEILLELARKFGVDEDLIRRYVACELYTVGLDLAAHEMALYVENKDVFITEMLEVTRRRLAAALLQGSGHQVSDTFAKLPTKITSWLQTLGVSKLSLPSIPLEKTYHLLKYLKNNTDSSSKEERFLNDLIESVKALI